MFLTPSDLSRLQIVALRHLTERIGLSTTDAELQIEFETLRIEALRPEVIDDLSDLQSELCEWSYLATGIRHIDITFLDELILSFAVDCESFDTVSATMPTATLESPVVEIASVADVQPESEELCTIADLIHHISNRTGMQSDSIQNTIALLHFKRFKYGDQEFIAVKSIDSILRRWAEAIAGDVAMALHEEATRPAPIPKTVKATTAKPSAKKPAAKKTAAQPKAEASAE